MAKKGKGGRNKGRTSIRNAALLGGEKTEIITVNGEKKFGETIKEEQVQGKTMKTIAEATARQIIAEKKQAMTKPQQSHADREQNKSKRTENFIKEIIEKKHTPSTQVKEQRSASQVEKKPIEKPVHSELVQRLKSSTSLSTPAMEDKNKARQNRKSKRIQKGASTLTDSLKQGQNVKKAPPAKKPPTRGR